MSSTTINRDPPHQRYLQAPPFRLCLSFYAKPMFIANSCYFSMFQWSCERIENYKVPSSQLDTKTSAPFSAFWLRSSVVSVLISLISDMWAIGSHDIKLIFFMGEFPSQQLAAGVLTRRPCVALLQRPGAPPPKLMKTSSSCFTCYGSGTPKCKHLNLAVIPCMFVVANFFLYLENQNATTNRGTKEIAGERSTPATPP